MHSFKFTVFLQSKNCCNGISQLLIIKSTWFHEYMYSKRPVVFQHQSQLSIFSHYFTRALAGIHMSRAMCFFSQRLLQPSIKGLIREDLKCIFIVGTLLQPCSFKRAYLCHKTSYSNICLKSIESNARKYLQPLH